MTITAGIEAGKTDRDENFPVASFLLAPRLRAPILSFYRFARAADDIADHAALSKRDKFAGLDFPGANAAWQIRQGQGGVAAQISAWRSTAWPHPSARSSHGIPR